MSDNFSKNIRKKTFRAKEMLMETLGKADKTVDEAFETNANNFIRQQKHYERLQRELLNYVQCLKASAEAGRGYFDAIRDAYDSEWTGADHVRAITHSLELLWDDYIEKLTDQSLNPLNSYCSNFVDLKTKISKRGRKLIDYDGARHAYESVKNNSRKVEESRMLKLEQDLEAAKQMYDSLNSELSNELPVLYDGRYSFLVNHMQTIFTAGSNFHSESVKLLDDVQAVVTPKIRVNPCWPAKTNNHCKQQQQSPQPPPSANNSTDVSSSSECKPPTLNCLDRGSSTERNPFASDTDESPKEPSQPPSIQNGVVDNNNCAEQSVPKADDSTEEVGNKSLYPDLSSLKILYKVRATHRYTAEDTDELSFEAGEVVVVVPHENPDEQDEGWLMGVVEATGKKGVFPANFTKPM